MKKFVAVLDPCRPIHLLTFFHIHDFTDKYKKLGELCSINGKNCVGELVCKKMEDGCDNGVGKCQFNEGKTCSFSISFWIRIFFKAKPDRLINSFIQTCLYPNPFQLSDSIAKEGEQCRWTSSYCEQVGVDGPKTCKSSQAIKYCEKGLKCTTDPNDSASGFCRKGGTTVSNIIKSESILQFYISSPPC